MYYIYYTPMHIYSYVRGNILLSNNYYVKKKNQSVYQCALIINNMDWSYSWKIILIIFTLYSLRFMSFIVFILFNLYKCYDNLSCTKLFYSSITIFYLLNINLMTKRLKSHHTSIIILYYKFIEKIKLLNIWHLIICKPLF